MAPARMVRYRSSSTVDNVWRTGDHTLKGVAQNLGMEHLYQVSSALCEAVRGSKPLTDPALWPPVEEAHAQVLAAIQEL